MAKIPFSQLKKIFTTRYTTGGTPPRDAPGQTTPAPGAQVPFSVLQKGNPEDTLRVTKQPRKAVIVITPFAAEDYANAAKMNRYALRATRDSLNRMEAPVASHLFYSDVISARNPIERDIGLQSQLTWLKNCDLVAVYLDFGVTPAMQVAINAAIQRNKKIEYRTIGSVA